VKFVSARSGKSARRIAVSNTNSQWDLGCLAYHWTEQRRGLRGEVPSIILCVKKWNLPAPQRRGSSHSGEGKNGRFHLITAERRGYKKIPLVGFQDIYKTDLQNLFGVDRAKLGGVSHVVTQIPSET
jgi:hypothetical protein